MTTPDAPQAPDTSPDQPAPTASGDWLSAYQRAVEQVRTPQGRLAHGEGEPGRGGPIEDAGPTGPGQGPQGAADSANDVPVAALEEEHVIESYDPRDFADDSGPQYEDEDFEEPTEDDGRHVAVPSRDTRFGDESAPGVEDAEPLGLSLPLPEEPFNPRLAFAGGGALIVPGRPQDLTSRARDPWGLGRAEAVRPQAPDHAPTSPASPHVGDAALVPVPTDADQPSAQPAAQPGAAPGAQKEAAQAPTAEAPTAEASTAQAPTVPEAPAPQVDPEEELPPLEDFKDRFTDRELTWMDFNERVLEQAEDPSLPLLERAWFAAIFSSNLDEFYMVRVAGLKRRIAAGITPVRASGLNGHQVLARLTERAQELTARQAALVRDDIRPALASHGIEILGWEDLDEEQCSRLSRYFRNQIYPVLTPLAVDPSHPFPYISGLSLNLAIILRNPRSGKEHFARVKVPQSLPRLIPVPVGEAPKGEEPKAFIPLEVVIAEHLDHLFPGMDVVEHHTFRVTRNENLEVEEDDAENLLKAMEKELERRRFGAAVRVEVEDTITPFVRRYLVRALRLSDADVFALPAPLDVKCLNILHDLDVPELKYPRFVPVTPAGLAAHESSTSGDIFAEVREHEVLLHHPYDSFSTSVQEFIAQAAADPAVLAIKQTLYRTSGDSPIVDALIEAADAGKQVVAIVEIKARFDEENNIGWARKLERAGVHVVYGMVGLKTHCKLSLVVRQEADGLRRYCHVGTGNYHPKTARGYEDLGLLTSDRDVAQDLTTLFNQLSGYAPRARFRRLLVAPRSLRKGLLEHIEQEIANKRAGKDAWVRIKVNSIIDESLIDALYRASRAGVRVDVVVRGICGIRAGVPGLSENIKVRSILGRYLEHSRIYAFCNDGDTTLYIGSADLMHRNLDRRVEALVRITDKQMLADLEWLVTHAASDAVSSWHMLPDGSWKRVTHDAQGNPLEDIQATLMAQARARVADGR